MAGTPSPAGIYKRAGDSRQDSGVALGAMGRKAQVSRLGTPMRAQSTTGSRRTPTALREAAAGRSPAVNFCERPVSGWAAVRPLGTR